MRKWARDLRFLDWRFLNLRVCAPSESIICASLLLFVNMGFLRIVVFGLKMGENWGVFGLWF